MKPFPLFLLLIALPLTAWSRDDSATDSLTTFHFADTVPALSASKLNLNTDVSYSDIARFRLSDLQMMKPIDLNMPHFNADMYQNRATVTSWHNGTIYLEGGAQTYPGLMSINTGTFNIGQTFGHFSVNLYGSAIKYGYFNGLQTSYGFGADVTYRFSERLSLTVFGSYHSPVMIKNPAIAGYVSVPSFGGYFDYLFSDKFGVQVGAQSYRSLLSRRWETQPIVKPYYRISSKASIGVDVGGIIYQLLKSNVGKNSWGPRNPTIGPPVMKMSEMMGY